MTTYKITPQPVKKTLFGKTTEGISEFIPGHCYRTSAATRVIFVGFGNVVIENSVGTKNLFCEDSLLFLSLHVLLEDLDRERITMEMTEHHGLGCFCDYFVSYTKPPVLTEDLGVFLSPDHFENKTVKEFYGFKGRETRSVKVITKPSGTWKGYTITSD